MVPPLLPSSALRRRRLVRAAASALAAVVVGLVPALSAEAVTYAQIEGSGSTWSEVIVQQWISDVDANGMRVTYNGSGSSQGRKNFAQNVTDFGISEIPYLGVDEFGNADNSNGREFAYVPIVAGGTAFTYQLSIGGRQVDNLRLSGQTIAKIFTNVITNWNDPAIKADNNGRAFPSLPITPVVRSDGSGTSAQFTRYLDNQFPSIWRAFNGRAGLTSYFPRKGRAIAASGSDQVMNTISSSAGNGTIGYVEYSYPLNKNYPVVKVLNNGGYYVQPTQYNVAVALTRAQINQDKSSTNYLTQILDGVYTYNDPRTYPLSSYSYLLLPTGSNDVRMTTAKRQTLADFMFYSLCQGQGKAGPYGYSPLPLNLVQAGFDQLAKLRTADPNVELQGRDVTRCNNPTFDGRNLSSNRLAKIAPQPQACDRLGAGPCGYAGTQTGAGGTGGGGGGGTTTGGGTGTGTTGGSGGPGTGTAAGGGPGTGGATGGRLPTAAPAGGGPAGAAGAVAGPVVNPDTGVAGGGAVLAGGEIVAVPTELAAARQQDTGVFAALAALELLALVLLPGLYALHRMRRTGTEGRR